MVKNSLFTTVSPYLTVVDLSISCSAKNMMEINNFSKNNSNSISKYVTSSLIPHVTRSGRVDGWLHN
jgi:hypothetical protein